MCGRAEGSATGHGEGRGMSDSPDIATEQGAWGPYRFRVYDRNYDGPGSAPKGMGATLDEAMADLRDREVIREEV